MVQFSMPIQHWHCGNINNVGKWNEPKHVSAIAPNNLQSWHGLARIVSTTTATTAITLSIITKCTINNTHDEGNTKKWRAVDRNDKAAKDKSILNQDKIKDV